MIEPLLIGRIVLILICAVAWWLDVTKRIIPNWLCLVAFAAGVAFTAWQVPTELGWHLLHAGVALAVGIFFYAINFVGGGDAKFYAGVAVWFSFWQGMFLLLCVSLATLVMFGSWFLLRRLRGIPVERSAKSDSGKFPYALGIGGGAVLALFL